MFTTHIHYRPCIRRACALLLAAICAGAAPACDDPDGSASMDASDDDDGDRSTEPNWLQCQTSTKQNGVTWTYTMPWMQVDHGFDTNTKILINNSTWEDPVMVGLTAAPNFHPRGQPVWQDSDGTRLKVAVREKPSGNRSIMVEHLSMMWTASAASGWCNTMRCDDSKRVYCDASFGAVPEPQKTCKCR